MIEAFEKLPWGFFLLGLAIVLVLLSTPGCKTPMPSVDVAFWAGDSAKEGISRAQDQKTMECRDPEFDNYTCLTYEDVQKIYDTLLECQQWPMLAKGKRMNWRKFSRRNPEVISHVISTKQRLESFQR